VHICNSKPQTNDQAIRGPAKLYLQVGANLFKKLSSKETMKRKPNNPI
jgi:hypothetical protein